MGEMRTRASKAADRDGRGNSRSTGKGPLARRDAGDYEPSAANRAFARARETVMTFRSVCLI